jgi:hypothetical protein
MDHLFAPMWGWTWRGVTETCLLFLMILILYLLFITNYSVSMSAVRVAALASPK